MAETVFRHVANFDALDQAGDGCWSTWYGRPDLVSSLVFVCPCGCGAVWSWNGDKDRPTVTPSIRRLDGCQWHGFLTDGIFKGC